MLRRLHVKKSNFFQYILFFIFSFIIIIHFLAFDNSITKQKFCSNQYVQSDSVINSDFITPDDFFLLFPQLINESSGIILFNGGLWTHNDRGGKPEIYKIDTISGKIIQTIKLKNANNHDWEDITQDADNIYIGDFGNNHGDRKDLKIYKIAKDQIPADNDNAEINASVIKFVYNDQKNFIKKSHNHNFDCEAMICYNDSLFLFTKNWKNHKTKLYALPVIPGDYKISHRDSYNINGLVTGADINLFTKEIALIGYINYVPFICILSNFEKNIFFKGDKIRYDLSSITNAQTEGITYISENYILISTEETKTYSPGVYKINIRLLKEAY